MTETTINRVTNIALTGDRQVVVTHGDPLPPPPPPPPPSKETRRVSTFADLKAVLADDVPDVTVVGTFMTNGPIRMARIKERIIRSEGGVIQSDGGDFHILDLESGSGGRLTILGLTVDGGWRARRGECPSDAAANFFVPNLDYLEMDGFTTRYSRRTGIFATFTGKLILRNGNGFAMPRDFLWSNGSKDVLVEGCQVQHCGDDGIGCHVPENQSDADRVVIIRNNEIYDTLGIKVLGGGKNILIENNKVYASGFYGIRLGIDPTTGEGTGTQRNITVRNNYIENVQITSLSHTGQRQGVWIFMHAPDYQVQNVKIDENILVSTRDNGRRLRDVYQWATDGGYAKPGFVYDATLNIGSEATRYTCKNSGDIVGANLKIGL